MLPNSIFSPKNIMKVHKWTRNIITVSNVYKKNKVGDQIEIKGWVKSVRNQKENVFIDLSDGSCSRKLQIFIPQKLKPDNLSAGSSIGAVGSINLTPRGQIELTAEKIEVYGNCVVSEGYPFAPRKQYSSEYVRQYPHFRARTNKFGALLRVRNAAHWAIHNYFNNEGFINVHTPILTSNDCEGAGEVFKVIPDCQDTMKKMARPGVEPDQIYFDRKAFLTVSGQLHLEAAVHGLNKVYTLGPTFRAENSRSRLHLSEFYMLEAEVAFVDLLDEILNCVEHLVKEVTKSVLNQSMEDVKTCAEGNIDELTWTEKKFPIITHEEALNILKGSFDSKEEELALVKHCGGLPTFVINWPENTKPFYMRNCKDNNKKVAAFDLLAPNIGEIVGGGLRENDFEKLNNKLPKGDSLDWYLDLRRFGGVPTGGFGLGFERYLQTILGIASIKDVIPFPRWPHNCSL